jgi:putative methionine-R-sulfoxide reductase with GAF domain
MSTGGEHTNDWEETLNRIKGILDSSDERRIKAERVAEAIRLSAGYRWVGIYDVGEREIANVAWSGPCAPTHPLFPINEGLSGEAVSMRDTVVSNDVVNDPRYLIAFGSTRSEIIVPVIMPSDGKVVGTLDVEDSHEDAFADVDRRFLEECARALTRLWNEAAAITKPEEE